MKFEELFTELSEYLRQEFARSNFQILGAIQEHLFTKLKQEQNLSTDSLVDRALKLYGRSPSRQVIGKDFTVFGLREPGTYLCGAQNYHALMRFYNRAQAVNRYSDCKHLLFYKGKNKHFYESKISEFDIPNEEIMYKRYHSQFCPNGRKSLIRYNSLPECRYNMIFKNIYRRNTVLELVKRSSETHYCLYSHGPYPFILIPQCETT